MVEVFKTTVNNKRESQKIVKTLEIKLPDARINFDMEDCDNILRIEANEIDIQLVIKILHQNGHNIELLK